MSLVVDSRRLFCTTADAHFGPLFESDEAAESFKQWMYRNGHGDARQYTTEKLDGFVVTWNAEIQFRRRMLDAGTLGRFIGLAESASEITSLKDVYWKDQLIAIVREYREKEAKLHATI